ncbi:MAG: hypothetical protein KDD22_05625 [Bdellovibrionales bacterium]|nr:hypothetical protein [Bdellovibrionales bacterium]
MKEPKWESATEEQVWKYVAWHLAKNDIKTLLVGGAVCAIYSEGAYKSGDLDFVSLSIFNEKRPEVMKSIGFKKGVSRHFIHPACKLFVEFVTGPAGIGDDIQIKPDKKEIEGQMLYIYSPTDCIRDRLASYIHFKARECLDQAVLVAERFPFNKKKVQEWCESEGAPQAYNDLMRKLKA